MECGRQLDIDQAPLSLQVKIKVQELSLTECSSRADCGSTSEKEVATQCQHKETRARYCTLIYSKKLCYHSDVEK